MDTVTKPDSVTSSAKRRDGVSPRPWQTNQYATIMDANGEAIFTPRIPSNGRTMRANAAMLVEAVNGRDSLREELDKLNDVAVNLMRSRDAALAEAERLRNALLMFAGEWDNYAAEEGIRAPAWSSLFRSFARSCREAAGEDTP